MLLTAERVGGSVWMCVCMQRRSESVVGNQGAMYGKKNRFPVVVSASWQVLAHVNVSDDIMLYVEYKVEGKCQGVCVCVHANTRPAYSEELHEASLRGRSKAVDLVWKSRELDWIKWSSEESSVSLTLIKHTHTNWDQRRESRHREVVLFQ